jgi:hypothetical protein
MIPRSKQPNEFDAFYDPDAESQDAYETHEATWEDAAILRALAQSAETPGSGAGEWVTPEGRCSPEDFSAEDLALARKLNSLFAVEREELPPLFIQTLAGDARNWAAPSGLIQRVTYHVFRRLHLPLRLPSRHVEQTRPQSLHSLKRRPRPVGLGSALVVVFLGLVALLPAFAGSMQHFLTGNTRVKVTSGAPKGLLTEGELTQYLSLPQLQQAMSFQPYWLGKAQGGYKYQSLLLHMGQQWANGPVLEVQYHQPSYTGAGFLSVREFQAAAGKVILQVVEDGAAHVVQINGQRAIYINGRWVRHRSVLVWEYGTQAELIYQQNGLFFWITADQRDGATLASLEAMAASLEHLYLAIPRPNLPESVPPPHAQVASTLAEASLGDVITMMSANAASSGGSTVYIALGEPPDDGA